MKLHKDDLDHDRQLTRSKHDNTREEDNHLATVVQGRLLTHQSGGGHGDVEASGDDSPSRQGAGEKF